MRTPSKLKRDVNEEDTRTRTHGDVDGVAEGGAQQLSGEAPLHPVAAGVAALLERLHVGERQLRPQLRLVGPLHDQWDGHALPVQVEVADVVTLLGAAAETNGLPGSEDGVWGEQSEGGNQEGVCGEKEEEEEDWHQKFIAHNNDNKNNNDNKYMSLKVCIKL